MDNLKGTIELYLEDEDAVLPEERTTPIVTTVSVEAHKKLPVVLGREVIKALNKET